MHINCFTNQLFGENTYILWHDEGGAAIVIDPGMMRDEERTAVMNFITAHTLHVQHILLTHCHIDHAFSASWMATQCGATVAASQADAQWAQAMDFQASMFHLKLTTEPLTPDQWITAGDKFTLDDEEIAVLATPGHTQGGLSFYIATSGVVFTGDTLFAGSVGRTDMMGGDHEALIEAINTQLMVLPDETLVVPGHGPTTTIGDERRNNPFL